MGRNGWTSMSIHLGRFQLSCCWSTSSLRDRQRYGSQMSMSSLRSLGECKGRLMTSTSQLMSMTSMSIHWHDWHVLLVLHEQCKCVDWSSHSKQFRLSYFWPPDTIRKKRGKDRKISLEYSLWVNGKVMVNMNTFNMKERQQKFSWFFSVASADEIETFSGCFSGIVRVHFFLSDLKANADWGWARPFIELFGYTEMLQSFLVLRWREELSPG